jgi:hypothetical protein
MFVFVSTFSVLQAAAAVSIGGSVLAVAVPSFLRNVHISRLAEPMDGLMQIGASASTLAAARGVSMAYPASVELTPSDVPRGVSVSDPENWQHPSWLELQFAPQQPHYYAFQFDSRNGAKRATFTARAMGDLDGDGLFSQFALSGEFRVDGEPMLNPLEIEREVE